MASRAPRPDIEQAAEPAARQREKGSASARSLLLTVLGEFVLPREGEAWTGSLIEALGALGVEEKSARQALSRTAAEGLLESVRHGRKVRWNLTETGDRLLREGTERIYGFMRGPHTWDGRWLVLTAGVPESQRRLRHRLRTKLTWLGLGSPHPRSGSSPTPRRRPPSARSSATSTSPTGPTPGRVPRPRSVTPPSSSTPRGISTTSRSGISASSRASRARRRARTGRRSCTRY
ncbi:hypothetical protein [Thermocatellispora tengchongensis]|uniref:hypothetical protein n=1 Tax=Thermocatellispora tengchongensis TaxID=1073253 RepID=UPI00362D2BF7